MRLVCTFLGPAFVVFSIFGFMSPDEVVTRSNGVEITGTEETKVTLMFLLIGVGVTLIRFLILKYRKLPDFSDDIPLLSNVEFEKTDDVSENIRR
jgi:hypothetical protein